MTLASGSRVGLSYVAETVRGTTPGSPSMKSLRVTSRAINLQKNTLQSNEKRSDRQLATLRHGFNQVAGNPGFELSLAAMDDMLEAALSGTWAAVTTGAISIDASATDDSFNRSTGSFLTDGFTAGGIVDVTGYVATGNNSQWRISSVTATKMIVTQLDGTAAGLTTESGGGDETIAYTGKQLNIGTTLRTFAVERRFTDISQYQVFNGVAVNQLSLNIQPEQIVGGTLDLIGMSAAAMSGTSLGTPAAAATNEPFSSFEGSLYEGGSQIAVVTGLDLQLQNNRTLQPVVGSKFSPDVFEGDALVTGTLTAFFENETLYNKFVNETGSSLDLRLDDLNGTDFMRIKLGNVKYTGSDMDPPQEGPVPLSMPFAALLDPTSNTSMEIQRSNV